MSRPAAPPNPVSVPVSSATERYLEASLAVSTVEAYASDWRDFELWCRTNRRRDADDCPVEALSDWLEAAGIADGIFRAVNRAGRVNPKALNPETVSRRLKTLAATAALPEPHEYSGHSLRAGLITSAKAAGVPEDRIIRHTRHRSVLVMRTYDRPEALWAEHPARMLC